MRPWIPIRASLSALVPALLIAATAGAQHHGRHDDRALSADPGRAAEQIAPVLAGLGDHHHPVTTASERAQMFFDQGLKLTYGFNHQEALRSFKEAARLDPMHTDAHVTLCSDYALAGDCDEARRTADRILDIDPGFTISAFTEKQPYRDAARLSQIADALRTAGLPE